MKKSLAKVEMPARMFRAVHDDVSGVTDFTIEGVCGLFSTAQKGVILEL